jgi:uncharacterized protein YceH (UPF0502 family)
LCGPVDIAASARSDSATIDVPDAAARIARLESEVAALNRTVQRLCTELGVALAQDGDVA